MHARSAVLLALLAGLMLHTGCDVYQRHLAAPADAPAAVKVTRISR